jgi:hypothetical protein
MCNEYAREIEMGRISRLTEEMKVENLDRCAAKISPAGVRSMKPAMRTFCCGLRTG